MSTTNLPAFAAASLRAEVAALDEEFRGRWHAWLSTSGRINATCRQSDFGGSGTTLDAPTAEQMRHAIAEQEHRWAVAA